MSIKRKRGILLAALSVAMGSALPSMAIMPGGTTVYGGLWNSNNPDASYGIYSLSPDGDNLLLPDPKGNVVGYPIKSAWIADGKLCGFYVRESYSIVDVQYYIEIDQEGEVLKFEKLRDDIGYLFTAVYNPDDLNIYGYGLTSDYSYALMKADAENPKSFTTVREFDYMADEECMSIGYDTDTQNLYGINAKGKFVKINRSTGIQTVISSAPQGTEPFVSGMCYAPKEKLFYWNAQLSNGSAIYTINPADGQFTKLYDCEDDQQYNFMICPDKISVAASPKAPEILSDGFLNGNLSGAMTVRMPDQTIEGDEITDLLLLTVMLDGENYSEENVQPGEEREINFENLSEGIHTFTFKVAFNGEVSDNTSLTKWIGFDTPKAVPTVLLTNRIVSWEATEAGVNGGFIDSGNLEYTVYLNGEEKFSCTGDISEWEHSLHEAELKRYTASVIVSSHGKSSEETVSNEVALGRPITPGFSLIPDREDVDRMTVIDCNNDGRTWSYSLYQECAKSSFGSGIPMDDWLILSPISLEKEREYILSFDLQSCNSLYIEEYVRVCIGEAPTPEEMEEELITSINPQRTLETYSTKFSVGEDGTYYIGFHNFSAPDMEGVLLSNISLIEEGAGVSEISTTVDSQVIYYNMQGQRIENPTNGIFIECKNGQSRKVTIN